MPALCTYTHAHTHTRSSAVIVLTAHSSEYAARLKPSWPSLLFPALQANASMQQPIVRSTPILCSLFIFSLAKYILQTLWPADSSIFPHRLWEYSNTETKTATYMKKYILVTFKSPFKTSWTGIWNELQLENSFFFTALMHRRSSFWGAEGCAHRRGGCISHALRRVFMQYTVFCFSYCIGTVWLHIHRLHCSILPPPCQSLWYSFHARLSSLWFCHVTFCGNSLVDFSFMIVPLLPSYVQFQFHLHLDSTLHTRESDAHSCLCLRASACKNHGSRSVLTEGRCLWGNKPEGAMNGVDCKGI